MHEVRWRQNGGEFTVDREPIGFQTDSSTKISALAHGGEAGRQAGTRGRLSKRAQNAPSQRQHLCVRLPQWPPLRVNPPWPVAKLL